MRHVLATVLAVLVVAPIAAAAPPPERLPAGSAIANVDVSGKTAAESEKAVRDVVAPVYETRPVVIRVNNRDSLVMPAGAGLDVQYRWMVEFAFALAAAGKPVAVPLRVAVVRAKLAKAVAAVARSWYRSPRNASVRFGVTVIKRIPGRAGRSLDERGARIGLEAELRHPTTERVVAGKVVAVAPAITTAKLRKLYPAYVSVDRSTHTLRLFRALRLVRTYKVAVGRAGFETPAGLRHVIYKDRNPSWTAPNRPWAYPYQGHTFPPGDPHNPLRAWFIALGDGIGIHGTSEEWTVGTNASHGCIRMRARDVSLLAPLVPVGTPVLIH